MASRWDFERAVKASDLLPLTRLVLLVLATYTEGATTTIPARHTPSLTDLDNATGMGRTGVRRHLTLAERDGWLGRRRPPVELARSKKARTTYLLTIPSRAAQALDNVDTRAAAAPDVRAAPAPELGPQRSTARAPAALRSDQSDLVSPLRARSRTESLIADLGADDDEVKIILDKIKTEYQPRSLGAYVAAMAESGDLADIVSGCVAQRRRVIVAELIAELRTKPECVHGDPGGDQPHPVTGEPLCPQCRSQRRRAA